MKSNLTLHGVKIERPANVPAHARLVLTTPTGLSREVELTTMQLLDLASQATNAASILCRTGEL